MAKKSISSKIGNIVFTIIVLIIVCNIYTVYKKYYYNGFIKAEYNIGSSKFTRDKEIKYSYDYSYKIESKNFNDAIFYKKVNVKPNTPYKLTCMVKTENVETENGKSNSGAQISIANTTENSESITGTNEWQKLEFIFDSKNRDTVEIGFRLGGDSTNCKGTAWFSNFKLEEGLNDNSNNWNIACFIMKNIDVTVNGEKLNLTMGVSDIENMKLNMERFKSSINTLSGNRMSVDYDIYEIDEPITSITYSEKFGYYLDPSDAQNIISKYLKQEEYDHIFVAIKLGDIKENIEIPVYDWIGLRKYGFTRYTDIQILDYQMIAQVIFIHITNI